jgi:hypothetical protein
MLVRVLALLLAAAAVSCGGRSAPAGVCDLPAMPESHATVERFCDDQCILETRDAHGRLVRLECDGTSCELFVDDVLRCSCTDLDWANTCSHGTPTCLATSGVFSFADYAFAACE